MVEHTRDARDAIRQQTAIGWQDLLEGLPTKHWQRLQYQHYREQNIRKSSRRWSRGLLQKLHHLAWHMWDHRNKVNNNVTKPQETQWIGRLHQAIILHYSKGIANLLPGDRHHMRLPIPTLLSRHLNYKKNWLTNVVYARQRFKRIQQRDNELNTISDEEQAIMTWMGCYHNNAEEEF